MSSYNENEIKTEVDDDSYEYRNQHPVIKTNDDSSSKQTKSTQLLQVLFQNSEKIIEVLEDQIENVESVVNYLDDNLSLAQSKYKKLFYNYESFYNQLESRIKKCEREDAVKENYYNKDGIFKIIKQTSGPKNIINIVKFLNRKIKKLSDLTSNEDLKRLKENYQKCEEFTGEKIKKLNTRNDCNNRMKGKCAKKRNMMQKNKKKIVRRKEIVLFRKRKNDSSDSTKMDQHRNFRNPMLKMFESYYNQHKPPSSILILHRKRIFVNYYLENGKRTTKSFNITHLTSLEEFRELIEEVKLFIQTHRVTKN